MKIIYGLKFLLIIFLVLSCRPSWITKLPKENKKQIYFTGTSSEKYSKKEAEAAAIDDAVRKMVSYMGLEASLFREDIRTEFYSSIQDQLNMKGTANIYGFSVKEKFIEEIKNEWGEKFYTAHVLVEWPKLQINKEKLLRQSNFNNRIKNAEVLIAEASSVSQNNNFSKFLELYCRAYQEILATNSILIDDVNLQSKRNQLKENIKSRLSNSLDEVEFFSDNDNQTGFLNAPLSNPLKLKIQARSTGAPMSCVPLLAEFVKGEGILSPTQNQTDNNGIALFSVDKILSIDPKNQVRIKIDKTSFSQWFTDVNLDLFCQSFFDKCDQKREDFNYSSTLPVLNIRICCKIENFMLGKETNNKILTKFLKEKLVQNGIRIFQATEETEYWITGTCDTRFASDNEGYVISCYADGELNAIERPSGNIVLSQHLGDIVGFGPDIQQASINALSQLSEQLTEFFINAFLSIINKE